MTLVPLDVTTQVRIRREDLSDLRRGDGLAALIADQLERYMGHMKRDWTYAHDPLAVASLARPDLLRTYPMRVNVETRGEYTRAQTVAERVDGEAGGPAVDVALEVQAGAFERWLLDTLAGSGTAPVVDGGT
jgi:inosine-uridine nucleoside N-ribohydrolase